jgi:deoxycytidine triphosphate deaminase
MKFCAGRDIACGASKIISEEHQVKPYALELTVSRVYSVKKEGDIDFSGKEEKEALKELVEPVKRSPSDDYGWWTLVAGEYIAEFNEKITVQKDCLAVLQPLPRTLRAGVTHPTLFFAEGDVIERTLLIVGKSGFNMKQNARISAVIEIKSLTD